MDTCLGGACILVGHSWAGLLGQLLALRDPTLVAGLVLVDPADEVFLASMPAAMQLVAVLVRVGTQAVLAIGPRRWAISRRYRAFSVAVSADPGVQSRLLAAYAACYATRAQVQAIGREHRAVHGALPTMRRLRTSATLPAVPIVLFSATKGLPRKERQRWTRLQTNLLQGRPAATHLVVEGAGHYIHHEPAPEVSAAILAMVSTLRNPSQDIPIGP